MEMQSRIIVGLGTALVIGVITQNIGTGIGMGIFIALLPSLISRKILKRIKS